MSQHTPTPWIATADYVPHTLCIRGGVSEHWPNGGTTITLFKAHRYAAMRGHPVTWGPVSDADKANAEFIVRAVNAHDELLAALEATLNAFCAVERYAGRDEADNRIIANAEAAIRKAKEGTGEAANEGQ